MPERKKPSESDHDQEMGDFGHDIPRPKMQFECQETGGSEPELVVSIDCGDLEDYVDRRIRKYADGIVDYSNLRMCGSGIIVELECDENSTGSRCITFSWQDFVEDWQDVENCHLMSEVLEGVAREIRGEKPGIEETLAGIRGREAEEW